MKTVKGLYYSNDHEWVRVEGNKAYIGVTDYAQHEMGEVVYVEMPEVDDEVQAGKSFGTIESVKVASDVLAPVSGKVIEINEALDGGPELINEDAFANHIIVVEMSNPDELKELMDEAAYIEFTQK
ncbi:MAG: glycine cleavage system protein GcvH [Peptostreptococcaceae bacterium]|nr:glycine cleavage system protein GcvH [Peptostreptococcaceae bacterium]